MVAVLKCVYVTRFIMAIGFITQTAKLPNTAELSAKRDFVSFCNLKSERGRNVVLI